MCVCVCVCVCVCIPRDVVNACQDLISFYNHNASYLLVWRVYHFKFTSKSDDSIDSKKQKLDTSLYLLYQNLVYEFAEIRKSTLRRDLFTVYF